MIRLLALAAFLLIASALSPTRLLAQATEQTVAATVTGQSVSMTVSPNSVDYGTVPFQTSRSSLGAPGGAVTFIATNTGNVTEDFYVRGSVATGSGFSWSLVTDPITCGSPSNNNKFRHRVTPAVQAALFLSAADDPLATAVAPTDSESFTSEIYMPCFGSDGAGQQATTNIVVTAVAP